MSEQTREKIIETLKGEYVNIHYDDLTNLIQRVREGEAFLSRFNAWMAKCPGNR